MSKRGASRQISKDDPSSNNTGGYEGMEVQGGLASEAALAARRSESVVRNHRRGSATPARRKAR